MCLNDKGKVMYKKPVAIWDYINTFCSPEDVREIKEALSKMLLEQEHVPNAHYAFEQIENERFNKAMDNMLKEHKELITLRVRSLPIGCTMEDVIKMIGKTELFIKSSTT